MKRTFLKRCLRPVLFAVILLLAAQIVPAREVSAATKGFTTIGGKSYYIKSDGTKQKGWLTLKGKKYYFDTKTGVQLKGWQYDEKKQKIRYFTKGVGAMVTGFLTDGSGNTRYFNEDDGLMVRGWMTDSKGYKYYFTSGQGVMAQGWMTDTKGQKRYFSKASGRMYTGWKNDSKGNTRYFDKTSGVMYQMGLKRLSGYYYYFDKSNGVLNKKGFTTISGKKYYFSPENGRAQVGWLILGSKTYYFDTKGVMFANVVVNIDGKAYSFDKDGVATKTDYVMQGDKVKIYDEKNDRYYYMVKEYLTHEGVASGEVSDLDLLAAVCEAEAGNQGKIGMEAVALCILNRTIIPNKEFPSQIRYVLYHIGATQSYPQYSVVRDGALKKRLDGQFYDRELAYAAAKEAMKIHEKYLLDGTPRKLKGFKTKDFNYMYFMMESSFWKQPLNFDKVDKFLYKDHMFFVDWV